MFNKVNRGGVECGGSKRFKSRIRGFDTLKAVARSPRKSLQPDWFNVRRRGGAIHQEVGKRVGSQSRGGRGSTMGRIDCIMYGTGLSC